ncbi:MAG: amidohydrolase family protein, partial [Planctomycetota bacterium]
PPGGRSKDPQTGGGSRRRLTDGDRIESAPAFSPDGTRIVYVTGDDVEAGSVEVKELGGGRARTITDRPGHYTEPAFSPDGEWVVYRRGRGDRYRGHAHSSEPGIYRARSSGEGTPLLVTREGRAPRYSAGGERILIESREGEKAALVSVNLLGGDRRVLVTSPHGGEYRISPDGKFLAFTHLFQVYAVPFPRTGGAIEVSPKMRSLPIRKLSEDGGEFIRWSSPTELTFLLGPDLVRVDVAAALAAPEDDTPHPRPARLGFEAEREIPPIDAVFRGARVITMRGDEIIEDGVVRVRGNRIVAVGRRGEVEIPGGCAVIDAAGKVLLPGWVDIHAHTGSSSLDLSPRRKWAFLAALSFGVTTTHDPSNNTRRIFAESEMVKAGLMVGPRVFSTGTILYGAEGDFKAVIDSEEDALRHLRRLRAYGAFSVKSYNQPRRNQRQQVLAAARELGMMVVPEGGSMFHHNMSMILDGHTTIEHAIPVAPLYEDVLHLVSRSGTAYTPTLVVGYGGPFGEQWWYQHSEVWRNRRLLRWVPRSVVDPRSRRRTMIPEEEFHHIDLARAAAEIFRRGGIVEIGAHGQLAGLDVHWEMWMLHQGGLTPHEMLRAATLNGARAIGLDGAIGSIEAGKLADIILLEGDPLEEPRNTTSVSMVMVDGRLHDARTLDRLLPERRPLPPGPDLNTIQVEHFHPCSCGTPGAPGW